MMNLITVKEHYENHLANFYSWLAGDFNTAKNTFKNFCLKHNITALSNDTAIDLGAGHGIQAVALAELGFSVKAVDFNHQLLLELQSRIGDLPIDTLNTPMELVTQIVRKQPVSLITCCGDTIAHLESFAKLDQLIRDCYQTLQKEGKLLLTFRDYGFELKGTSRMIPVKSDDTRILTCILDYEPEHITVTDLLYEKVNGKWEQKVSAYKKLRVTEDMIGQLCLKAGFAIRHQSTINRMIHMILIK